MEGDSGGSEVVVAVVVVVGGGCGCLSALLGSGAATALLTLEMMIYDRSSPGQPRLNSTERPEPILDRSNGRPGLSGVGCLVERDTDRPPFVPFCPPDGRPWSDGASSEVSSVALGLLPELELMVAMAIGGDPSEMIRSYTVSM